MGDPSARQHAARDVAVSFGEQRSELDGRVAQRFVATRVAQHRLASAEAQDAQEERRHALARPTSTAHHNLLRPTAAGRARHLQECIW